MPAEKASKPTKSAYDPNVEISMQEAAAHSGVSVALVRKIVSEGYVKRTSRGRIALGAWGLGYTAYKDASERRSTKSAGDSRVRDARAEEIEMRNAERRRDLIPIGDAIAEYDALVAEVREAFQSIPARLTRETEMRRKIEAEVNAAQERVAKALLKAVEAARSGSTEEI